MCDQLATVDLRRLTEPVGFLTLEEMQRVSDALALVLDL
ncbi:type II toxin-antitoxin system PemK/MazF family toxin [Marihabitans asiaticum]